MNSKIKNNKKTFIALLVFIVAILILAAAYFTLRPKTVQGSKNITITVAYEDGSADNYDLSTDAEYLQQAMDEAGDKGFTYHSEEGPYGAMVDTVNSITADYDENQAYWSFYVNDEYCNYGISEQPVEDGDTFRIVYTTDGSSGNE